MVKAIIFDCFGVLTTDKWREFVASLPECQRQAASDFNRAYGGAHISKAEFLRSIQELTGRQPQDIDKTLDNETNKNDDLLELIKTLRPKYKIGLLSNVASNWIRDHFLSLEEQKLFDNFVFSYEVHITKPDPDIFKLAADRLGVVPSECILVDDVEYYCGIAQDLGMQTICYRDFRQTKTELDKLLS
ncbi:MAG: HAD-IA family hydrolase [Patescibacteria group bacterium]